MKFELKKNDLLIVVLLAALLIPPVLLTEVPVSEQVGSCHAGTNNSRMVMPRGSNHELVLAGVTMDELAAGGADKTSVSIQLEVANNRGTVFKLNTPIGGLQDCNWLAKYGIKKAVFLSWPKSSRARHMGKQIEAENECQVMVVLPQTLTNRLGLWICCLKRPWMNFFKLPRGTNPPPRKP